MFLQEKGLYRPDPSSPKVRLKCEGDLEAGYYREVEPNWVATERIERICHHVPIHAIFGGPTPLV